MHEVSIMQSTLDIAFEQAKAQGATRVHQLCMRIGSLAGVVEDSLRFAFDAMSPGTMAEGATLVVESVSAACYCPTCQREFEAADVFCECPTCKQPSGQIVRGRELELVRLEVS